MTLETEELTGSLIYFGSLAEPAKKPQQPRKPKRTDVFRAHVVSGYGRRLASGRTVWVRPHTRLSVPSSAK